MPELGARANEIKALYEAEGLEIHPGSGLSELINRTLRLAASAKEGPIMEEDVLLGLHLSRVWKAILPLKSHPRRADYLKKLKSGNLRFLYRTPSPARDCLFELEVYRSLNELRSNIAELEEPDIVFKLTSMDIGVACKKIYSKKNLSKTLSNAVRQIRLNSPKLGIVAFGIEDLFPKETVVEANTFDEASNFLSAQCQNFLADNAQALIKYFKGSDIIGALAVASTVVKTKVQGPRYSNMQQWFLWSAPELNENAQKSVAHLRELLGRNVAA